MAVDTVEVDFDVLDEEDDSDIITNFSAAKRQIMENKTLLPVDSEELNNRDFRNAYLRRQITPNRLLNHKKNKDQILAEHADEIKMDPKKTLIFKFVKQKYISWFPEHFVDLLLTPIFLLNKF